MKEDLNVLIKHLLGSSHLQFSRYAVEIQLKSKFVQTRWTHTTPSKTDFIVFYDRRYYDVQSILLDLWRKKCFRCKLSAMRAPLSHWQASGQRKDFRGHPALLVSESERVWCCHGTILLRWQQRQAYQTKSPKRLRSVRFSPFPVWSAVALIYVTSFFSKRVWTTWKQLRFLSWTDQTLRPLQFQSKTIGIYLIIIIINFILNVFCPAGKLWEKQRSRLKQISKRDILQFLTAEPLSVADQAERIQQTVILADQGWRGCCFLVQGIAAPITSQLWSHKLALTIFRKGRYSASRIGCDHYPYINTGAETGVSDSRPSRRLGPVSRPLFDLAQHEQDSDRKGLGLEGTRIGRDSDRKWTASNVTRIKKD